MTYQFTIKYRHCPLKRTLRPRMVLCVAPLKTGVFRQSLRPGYLDCWRLVPAVHPWTGLSSFASASRPSGLFDQVLDMTYYCTLSSALRADRRFSVPT